MKSKKILNVSALLLFVLFLTYGIYYLWFALPIISGYNAKNACSCFFIQGRSGEDIAKTDLGAFPLSLGSFEINRTDSSVSGSVMGHAHRKAIFRKGLGCTLVNEWSAPTIREQKFNRPGPVFIADTSRWLLNKQFRPSDQPVINQTLLDSALSFVLHHRFQEKEVHTRAALVVLDGKIIGESYAPGFNASTQLLGWSMAKSITGALIGVLVKEGKLDVTQRAPIPQWSGGNDKRRHITVEHLLQQTSGLNFAEDYSSYSSATNMLFYKGDMAGYVASRPLREAPGSVFYYSSGNSNLLSKIIQTSTGQNAYHSFPYKQLFYKVGMYHSLLEPDASGTFVGSSYIYATARDYARFGCLYLNDGVWNGERILPDGWVKKSVTAPNANKLKNYGYQFWLNGFDEHDTRKRAYPEAPADMFMAKGYGGQRIYIIPTKKLVVVRLGLNSFDENRFLKMVLKAV